EVMSSIDVRVFLNHRFDTEEKCTAYLEKMRWPDGVRCSACGNTKISRIRAASKTGKARHLYQCLEKSCRYQFSATTGTIFHDSHLPLTTCFSAVALVGSEEAISARQLRRELDVQYKTAQHVLHRIQEALRTGSVEYAATAVDSPEQSALAAAPSSGLEMDKNIAVLVTSNADSMQLGGPGTTVDNALTIAAAMAQMAILPPLFFVNCISRVLG